jgi:hypothetical protein
MNNQSPSKPSYSRNILRGNAANKKGVSVDSKRFGKYRKEKARIPNSQDSVNVTGATSTKRKLGDVIIKGPPPKKEVTLSNDLRFTIPTSPRNKNIFNQVVVRSICTMNDVMVELRSCHRAKTFTVDEDHDITMID